MKKYGTIFLAGIIVSVCMAGILFFRVPSSGASDNGELLTVGMMSGWAPFMTINGNGEYEGFDVDVAQEIAQRMNRHLIIEDLGSLPSCFVALDQGRTDMVLSGLDITEKRLEKMAMVHYTGADVQSLSLIFWNEVPSAIHSMEDLRQIGEPIVCVESGSAQEKFLDTYDFVIKKRMNSVVDMVLDVRFGKSLAALVEPRVAARLARKNPEMRIVSVPLSYGFQIFGCGIAIKKENRELIDVVTSLIKHMYADGTLKKLEEKWQLRE